MLGGAGRYWEALGGAGGYWEALGGTGRYWETLGGTGTGSLELRQHHQTFKMTLQELDVHQPPQWRSMHV